MDKDAIKDALKPNLTRPLDKTALSNDSAMLRNLTGMLNNPALTGAVAPPATPPSNLPEPQSSTPAVVSPTTPGGAAPFPSAQSPGAAPTIASRALESNPVAQNPPGAATATPAKVGLRLFFTGRGTSETAKAIGATEYSIALPAIRLAQKFFNAGIFGDANVSASPGAVSFLATIRAWGAGEISAAFPLTPARAIFIQMIKSLAGIAGGLPEGVNWKNFGSNEGFWIDATVQAAMNEPGRVVITGISDRYEFDYLRSQKFSHWHIMARPGIGGNVDELSSAFDNDVTKQVSVQRNGPKLRAIWKDSTPPTSGRLWSIPEFVQAAALSAIAASAELNVSLE